MWPRLILAILVLALGSGCEAITRPAETTNGLALSAWATAAAMPVNEKPKPSPSDDKCENCGGSGKVGDGRVMVTCRVCNGTGKKKVAEISAAPPDAGSPPTPTITPPPEPKKPEVEVPKPKRYILMYSRPDCVNCDKWIATEADNWRRQGYTVLTRPDKLGRPVPWFRVVNEEIDQAFLAGLTWTGYVKYLEQKKEKKP